MSAFVQALPEPVAGAGDETEIDPMAPVVPQMVTSLVLTPEQEDRLATRILNRINDLMREMGLEGATGGQYPTGWMWERHKNQLQYDNQWEWRKALGGIFEFSNLSLNLSKRYARLMSAKCSDDLVGTDPFFSFMPTDVGGDPTLAKQGEAYVQDQMAQSNTKKRIKGAQKLALIRNECTVKISWVTNDTHFRGPGTVAVGPFRYSTGDGNPDRIFKEGEPVMTPKGNYIYQKDDMFDDPNVKGIWRLEKEPSVSSRYPLEFAYIEVLDQTLHGYEGLDVRSLDYRDFLCPLNAATVHEADINVHLFDEQWERMKALYNCFPVSSKYFSVAYASGEKQPKLEKAEEETVTQSLNIGNYADVYIRCNPFEGDDEDTGMESEIWAVMDRTTKKLVWYDYLGNHMARRPFEVIPGIERVENRWYGVGVFEMLQHKQDYVDTQFNRVNWKSMKSSSLRFRIKNAVAQWKAGEEVVFGDDTVYDIEDPRFDAKNPPFFEWQPHEIDEYAMKLIELMIQAGSTEVGIVGPDDGAMAGLDTTKLATGIKSLERTGNLLMKFTEADHADAIADILDQCVDFILERMDADQVIWKADTESLVALNREEVRKLQKSVKLLLTRSRSTETIETCRMVIQTCREYMEVLTPFEKYKLRPEYLRILKSLEVPDAAELLDEVSRADALAWLQQQANQPPPLEPKTSIATKYDNLERSEQEQILKREGITPASLGEVKQGVKDEAAKEGAIAGEKAKEEAKHAPPPAKK